ncbi:MAG: RNA-binding S4 domain-containing protein [Thermoleophilia bacterium]|nr:RNA-binding S4 domain-containing protein [Thermoleophilia bacterium]
MAPRGDGIRLDKWLWAARFFKTRSLATEAVNGGRVHVNDARVKASRDIRLDDTVQITRPGSPPVTVIVCGISATRGPATVAEGLYRETEESHEAGERAREIRRMTSAPPGAHLAGRPTKRDRRRFDDSRGRGG